MANIKRRRLRQKLGFKFNKSKKQSDRLLAFTKHRDVIFKSASDLCTVVGVDIVILITSLCGITYCFVHPNVESVQSQFLYQTLLPKSILEPYQKVHIEELNKEINEVRKSLKVEEKRAMILKEKKDARPKKVWEEPIPELSTIAIENVKRILGEMQVLAFNKINEQYLCEQAIHGIKESVPNHM
ncbi:agamous-like MADS-box protein AGL62 [Lactuca sativa]|uniref:agamous-like MADS-box protein AGL62 n=1 Tax=Lactuca sativa TaxID=4236 RepID=UPI0022AE6E70|nr:agamous-like MADS-box protein AGL62 [Lactuca sativa]